MNKKWSLGLMSMAVLASTLMVAPVFCASNLKLEYANSQQQTQSNTISFKVKLTNTSGAPVSLSDYTIRYYYTKDQNLTQAMWCDNAGMMSGGNYTTQTSNVVGTFYTMTSPTDKADTYLEIGFKSAAGTLAANGTLEVQIRVTNTSWANYNQSNDFSFGATTTSYATTNNMTVYEKGVLVSGTEPAATGVVDSTLSKTAATYDKNTAVTSDVSTKMTLNGNTLDNIKLDGTALAATNYAVTSDGTLTLNPAYLKTLAVGTYKYVFDFSAGTDPIFTLTVVDTTDYDVAMVLPTVTVKAGDTTTLLVKVQNLPTGINNADFSLKLDTTAFTFVEAAPTGVLDTTGEYGSFYTKWHDTTGLLNVLYADSSQTGQYLLKENGAFMAVKVTAKKDFTGAPLTLNKLGAINDVNLNNISIAVKTK